jgi:hypothetical protein
MIESPRQMPRLGLNAVTFPNFDVVEFPLNLKITSYTYKSKHFVEEIQNGSSDRFKE